MPFGIVGNTAVKPLETGRAVEVNVGQGRLSAVKSSPAGSSRASAFLAAVTLNSRSSKAKRKALPSKYAGTLSKLDVDTKAAESPLDIFKNDWSYLKNKLNAEEHESHEVQRLQEKLGSLKAELDSAHVEVHKSEDKVTRTLSELRQLESVVGDLKAVASSPAVAPKKAAAKPSGGSKGLHSTLDLEPGLAPFWYPVDFTSHLKEDVLVPIELLGESWVLFRDETGTACCVRDECAHRACPLSLGQNVNGRVECAYHGWQFRGDGVCDSMPSTAQCKGVAVTALRCVEEDGLIYIWPSTDTEPDLEVPAEALRAPGDKYIVHSELTLEVPVEHGLLIENLLDLAHAPFTHTSTFARGWPIPDAVKFKMQAALGGNWEPYPIDMSFLPPVMTLSTIGLNQPGNIVRNVRANDCEKHLHQLHVCIPSKRGHTRLLYRMSLDFMPWIRHLPGIDMVWKLMANQVLGEDLRLVVGQQDRMKQGGNTWTNPVAYDKLAVRYRRWRNSLGDTPRSKQGEKVAMSAGEMLIDDEE